MTVMTPAESESLPSSELPQVAADAVLQQSEQLPKDTPLVRGYDFSGDVVDYDALLSSYKHSGFQATNFGIAVDIINEMISWKPAEAQIQSGIPRNAKCQVFLGYTSNMISSGIRETIRYMVKNRHVHAIVTSAGGVEEDIIKCLGPTGVGSFRTDDASLRKRGINRIGNLVVPNDNYCKFEDWIVPLLDEALVKQKEQGQIWSPSTLIKFFGERIDNEDSVLYWAAKNDIPIFCPALTDGSIGDMLFFHSYKNPGLIVDLVQDIRRINRIAIGAPATGMIIVGGGIVKHHIANANLMRNGADFSVYLNTGQEFDGSDAGASPNEAVSWGKIKINAKKVKIHAEASLVLPLLVAQTFAKTKQK
ncbi:deoxyhypusine synthase [Gracilaria domingensis]|nr:deoxyhypusine synthase [Gracilaria domingensis]